MTEHTLLKEVSPIEYKKLASCCNAVQKRFHASETILLYGEGNYNIGVLLQGKAQLVKTDANGSFALYEHLSVNDVFGEDIAFPPHSSDSISVIAESDCTVLFIPWRRVIHTCTEECDCHRLLVDNLFRLIAQKATALSERIEILSCHSIRDKLLCYFRMMTYKADTATFMLPFSFSRLADYICTDRSAMMRELKKLKQEGLVSTSGRAITFSSETPA